ncbi:MAG TPA: molybdenum cofactor cytidylyltransferase [Blastocatellia bacterium]|nr:molybdenum cofactor cytidylyltransferase [Blastocatellia bacterium]
MITAIIPAAGTSSRMGEANKLLLPFRGRTVIENAVDTLLESRIAEILIVVGFESEKVIAALSEKPRRVKIVENPEYEVGMSTSIKAGVAVASAESEAIMIYLADMPLLEPADINRLIDSFREAKDTKKSIVVPVFEGRRGNPVILDARLKADILDVVGDIGCRRIIKNNPDKVSIVEMMTDHVVRDIDSPADYEELLR